LPSPQAQDIVLDSRRKLSLGGGYLSSNRHLPFFTVETPDDRGAIVGVGWSGRWAATFAVDDDADHVRTRVGLSESHSTPDTRTGSVPSSANVDPTGTRFTLEPGETVRSPRILALFWDGKRLHGHNMFRRLLYDRYVPDLRGEPQRPLVSFNTWFADYEDDHMGGNILRSRATADTVSALLDAYLGLDIDLFTIDTGWYETTAEYGEGASQWRSGLGQWTHDEDKYPEGFRPIADRLAERNTEFGLWFAPEIAGELSPLHDTHPEWLKAPRPKTNDPDECTLRLKRPDTREWFLDRVERLIDEGLTCYRQDLYTEYGTDQEYRTGVAEMKHIAGLYELWDSLRECHPDLIMEGCCGGGRRIDLETISRFHWHQKSDRWFDPESDQCGLYGANLYLPGGIINVPTERADDYGAWSAFAGQLCLGWDATDEAFSPDRAREQIDRYKRFRHRLSGDFYPLTPCSLDATWLGYQFHCTDLDEGLAFVFKRQSDGDAGYPETERFSPTLRGIDPAAEYAVQFEGHGRETTMTGDALATDLEVDIPDAPGAELIAYEPR